jgi:hypothetical protein
LKYALTCCVKSTERGGREETEQERETHTDIQREGETYIPNESEIQAERDRERKERASERASEREKTCRAGRGGFVQRDRERHTPRACVLSARPWLPEQNATNSSAK